jgi:hypothetical protein
MPIPIIAKAISKEVQSFRVYSQVPNDPCLLPIELEPQAALDRLLDPRRET